MNPSNKLLSDITAFRTYSKYLPHIGRRESLEETVNRTMTMDLERFPKLSAEIVKAYSMVHDLKVMPSMRRLQFAGAAIEQNNCRSYNCSFLSIDHPTAFSESLFLLLSGVGVGFSVQKHHTSQLPKIQKPREEGIFVVHDSIQGWAQALDLLIKAYFYGQIRPVFDFSAIRQKGSYLVTTGARAPGPEPLRIMLRQVEEILIKALDRKLKPIEVHDIICISSDAVLAGGIRRAALISLFDKDDTEMLNAKSGTWWEKYPWRARANNSAMLLRGEVSKDEFTAIFEACQKSGAGEPGFYWTNNLNWGANPCVEIALKSQQFCNLTTLNANGCHNEKEFLRRVRAAAVLGTIQASYTDFPYLRPAWKENSELEALLGVSMTGVADAGDFLTPELLQKGAKLVLDTNEMIAKKIGINLAARATSLKPEGCRPWHGLVTTDKGIYTLQELFMDHQHGEKWSPIKKSLKVNNGNRLSKTFHNGKSEVLSVQLTGGISLESTKNHPWFVVSHKDGRKNTRIGNFVKTEELKPGDVIEINLSAYSNTNPAQLIPINIFNLNMSTDRFQNITFPTHMSEDLAWLIGYIWADGSITSKNRVKFFEQDLEIIKKVKKTMLNLFNLEVVFTKSNKKDMFEGSVSSAALVAWLHRNGIEKYSQDSIGFIPLCIRESSKNDIIAFIAGFADGDGCVRKDSRSLELPCAQLTITQKISLFTKHLQDVAMSVGIVLGRSVNSKRNSFGKNPMHLMHMSSASTFESAEILKKNMVKLKYEPRPLPNSSTSGSKHTLGIVVDVKSLGEMETYDVEVENEPWFYAGAVKSHNTSSCVLGSSSGVHDRHSEYYIRRIRMNKDDALYKYLQNTIPELCEDDITSATGGVVSLPQESPKGSYLRENTSALDLLNRAIKFNQNWVAPGHRSGDNKHNVSVTISVREEEWAKLGESMWKNRDHYTGISLLPFDGGTYQQAPFETCSKEKFEEMSQYVKTVDLRNVIEKEDKTERIEQLSCVGGVCELN